MMWPVSDVWKAAIRGAHVAVVEVVPYWAGKRAGDHLVPVGDGSIEVDFDSIVRRTLSLSVPGSQWLPQTSNAPLSPFGAELAVSAGIEYPDRTRELVPAGVFRVQSANLNLTGNTVDVAASDRMQLVEDHRFTTPYTTPSNTSTWRVIRDLILDAYPDAEFRNAGVTDAPLRRGAVYEESRTEAIQAMADSLGATIGCAPDGVFTLAPLPDLDDDPVAVIDAGPNGVLVEAARTLSREGIYNGVSARGDSSDPDVPPVSALVVDTDPKSPTYWDGQFGHKPRMYASPVITTVAQARSAAAKILKTSLSSTRAVNLSAVPDPALDVGDIIEIRYPTGGRDVHVLRTMSVPLTAEGDWTATTSSTTYVGQPDEQLTGGAV